MGVRIVSQAVVIAVGARESGEKCVLGVDVGSSESQQFWLEFCRSLLARGLQGVQLVISDAHVGLKHGLAQYFPGASWQRCRVHDADLRIVRMRGRDHARIGGVWPA